MVVMLLALKVTDRVVMVVCVISLVSVWLACVLVSVYVCVLVLVAVVPVVWWCVLMLMVVTQMVVLLMVYYVAVL